MWPLTHDCHRPNDNAICERICQLFPSTGDFRQTRCIHGELLQASRVGSPSRLPGDYVVHGVPQQHDMHRRCPGRMSGCRGPIADLETNSFSGEFAFHDCLRRSWALSGTAGGCCCLSFHGSAGGLPRTAGGLLRECWSTAGELLGDCCGTAGGLLVEPLVMSIAWC